MVRELDFIDDCYKDKDLSLLKKLTLVIPTYNRNYYLSRCLWYHAHFPFGQIIVADSSPEEKKVMNRNTVAKIRKMFGANVLYLEYLPETEKYGGDIYRKWGDAVQHVDTEFSEICTDKEFVNPIVCRESILFLEKNPDYVSAFGKRLSGVMVDSVIKLVSFRNMQSTDDERPLDRLTYCCCGQRGFSENVFHVNRKEIQKISQNNHIIHGINDIRYGEMVAELQYYLFGKVKIFDSIGRIRDNSNIISSFGNILTKSESSSSRYVSINHYSRSLRKNLHKKAIDCLFLLLPQNEQTEETKQIITRDCNKIIQWWMCPKYNVLFGILSQLFGYLPKTIKEFLSSRIGFGSYAKDIMSMMDVNTSDDMFSKLILRIINNDEYSH